MHSLAPELLYLPLSHCFASVPSHVWPLGQAVHSLSEMYSVAAHVAYTRVLPA